MSSNRNMALARTEPDSDRPSGVQLRRPLSRDLERLAMVTRISSLDHAMPAAYREKMRMLADELDGLMGKAMALEASHG